MQDSLRVCLFDAGNLQDPPFAQPFSELDRLAIVGQASDWEELREWLHVGTVDVVAINLDDDQGLGMHAVERIAHVAPGCGVVGVSAKSDPAFIIGAMRAGCSQFVPWPIDTEDLRRATDRMTPQARVAPQGGKRICVVGSSGGVGATTLSCNLAMELGHLTDRPIALVDMNLEFGDVGCSFDCSPTYSISDICRDGVEPDVMMVEKALHPLPCNVSIMARPERIEDAREVAPEGVQAMLNILAETHPFVVVDLPRMFSFLSVGALDGADRIVIVTQLSVPCIRNATRIYQCLTQMGADESGIEIVLNRCKASYERITPDEVEAHFKRPLFGMIPNDYRRIQSSLDLGHPVTSDSPQGPARIAIQEMAKRLAGVSASDEGLSQGSGGLLGRFWRRNG